MLQTEFAAASRKLDTAVFAMACFWSGESRLGSLDGVVETRPGFLHEEEVVEVRYDPEVIPFPELVKAAQRQHCARKVFSRNPKRQEAALRLVGPRAARSDEPIRPDRQPKYYLANTSFRHVPMSPMQATRVNGAIGSRRDPTQLLSPRQREILHLVERHPRAGWPTFVGNISLPDAWAGVQRVVEGISFPLDRNRAAPLRRRRAPATVDP